MQKKQSGNLAEVVEHNEQLRKAYRSFRKSPDGKLIMADLEKRFYHIDMTASAEYPASVKIGRHSVIYYVRVMGEEK